MQVVMRQGLSSLSDKRMEKADSAGRKEGDNLRRAVVVASRARRLVFVGIRRSVLRRPVLTLLSVSVLASVLCRLSLSPFPFEAH